jgi:hypothetical protein
MKSACCAIAALLHLPDHPRKTANTAISPYRGQAELDEAPVQLAGSRRSELERTVADYAVPKKSIVPAVMGVAPIYRPC